MGVRISRAQKINHLIPNSSTNNQHETKSSSAHSFNTSKGSDPPSKPVSDSKTPNFRDSNENELKKKNSPPSITSDTRISCHGDSAKPSKQVSDDYSLIREADQHWVQVNQARNQFQLGVPGVVHSSCASRWMNNAHIHPLCFGDNCLNNPQVYSKCHCHNFALIDRRYPTRTRKGNRRLSTSGSVTSLMDMGTNHRTIYGRRCSKSRCWSSKSDMDTRSADIVDSPMNPIGRSMQDARYSTMRKSFEIPYRDRVYMRKSAICQNSDEFPHRNRIFTHCGFCSRTSNQPCSLSRCSELSEETCPSLQSDLYPLRYVFYVEDLPSSMEAFTTGGAISTFARDSRCRVYLHARNRDLDKSTTTQIISSRNYKLVEPALYYQGKRVCPVTVAAPNLFRLRRFLETVDAHYPEFNASTFLSDYLITPTQTG